MPAKNKKLTITPCTVDKKGNVSEDSGKKFEVMLNPASYKQNLSISYNQEKTLGQYESDQNFSAVNSQKLDFSIILDGTGVVATPKPDKPDVKSQIDQLCDVVYNYQSNKHEPNHLKVLWGSLIFYGRLESMAIDYTLFKPDGAPLRAEISLSFTSFTTGKEEALKANKNSPDMTHIVRFKAGDTIPHLCYQIYGEGAYYQQVARVNNITNFRSIKPGTILRFPPLR